MKKGFVKLLLVFSMVFAVGWVALPMLGQEAYAGNAACNATSDAELKDVAGCNEKKTVPLMLNSLISVALGVIGVLATIVIIIGGVSYSTSNGDPTKASRARMAILAGVVGMVVALLASAIVNFISGSI